MQTAKWFLVAVAWGMLLLAGCGDSRRTLKTQPVEGVVTLDSKPIAGATGTKVTEGSGASATGTTDASGKYTLTAAVTGEVQGAAGAGTLAGDYFVGVRKAEIPQMSDEEIENQPGKPAFSPPSAAPKLTHVVPVRYNDPRKSGIKVTVKEGQNTIPLELSSK